MPGPKELIIDQKVLQDGIKQFNELTEFVENASSIESPKHDVNGKKIDNRDYGFLAKLFTLKGKTKEDRQADFNKKFKQMVFDFTSGDPARRKPYLDMLYDNIAITKKGYNEGLKTPEEFVKFTVAAESGQAFWTKAFENEDYFFKDRCNTIEKQRDLLFLSNGNTIASKSLSKIKDENPDFKLVTGLTGINKEWNYQDQFYAGALEASGKNTNTIDIDIPTTFYCKGVSAYDDEALVDLAEGITYDSNIKNQLKMLGGSNADKGVSAPDGYYINGKKAMDIVKDLMERQTGEKISSGDLSVLTKSYVQKKLADGDCVVSFSVPRNINGKLENDVILLKPNVEAIHQQEYNKCNRFRQLFDWGPFAIKPNQKSVDKLYKKEAKKYEAIVKDKAQAENIERINDAISKKEPLTEKEIENNLNIAKSLGNQAKEFMKNDPGLTYKEVFEEDYNFTEELGKDVDEFSNTREVNKVQTNEINIKEPVRE